MSNIKRWALDYEAWVRPPTMCESVHGNFVLYEDHEARLRLLEKVREAAEGLLGELRTADTFLLQWPIPLSKAIAACREVKP